MMLFAHMQSLLDYASTLPYSLHLHIIFPSPVFDLSFIVHFQTKHFSVVNLGLNIVTLLCMEDN